MLIRRCKRISRPLRLDGRAKGRNSDLKVSSLFFVNLVPVCLKFIILGFWNLFSMRRGRILNLIVSSSLYWDLISLVCLSPQKHFSALMVLQKISSSLISLLFGQGICATGKPGSKLRSLFQALLIKPALLPPSLRSQSSFLFSLSSSSCFFVF